MDAVPGIGGHTNIHGWKRKGALDNIWIERFWKLIKYDYIYLNLADDGFELYEEVQNHIACYNDKTHHTTRQTPNDRYLMLDKTAAG